jgi:hypothetical protein
MIPSIVFVAFFIEKQKCNKFLFSCYFVLFFASVDEVTSTIETHTRCCEVLGSNLCEGFQPNNIGIVI